MFYVRLVCGIVASVFLIVACGCIGGWKSNEKHNQTLKLSQCLVQSHDIVSQICSDGDVSFKCFTSYVILTVYDVENIILEENKRIQAGYVRQRVYTRVTNWLEKHAPLNQRIACYYQVNHDNEYSGRVQFGLHPEKSVFIASMVFFAFTIVTLIVWGVLEILNCK